MLFFPKIVYLYLLIRTINKNLNQLIAYRLITSTQKSQTIF